MAGGFTHQAYVERGYFVDQHEASLAATEAADTLAFVAQEIDGVVVVASEAADTAAVDVALSRELALAATEAADTAAVDVALSRELALAATEAPDTALFRLDGDNAVLAVAEPKDGASIAADVVVGTVLASTDARDAATFRAFSGVFDYVDTEVLTVPWEAIEFSVPYEERGFVAPADSVIEIPAETGEFSAPPRMRRRP